MYLFMSIWCHPGLQNNRNSKQYLRCHLDFKQRLLGKILSGKRTSLLPTVIPLHRMWLSSDGYLALAAAKVRINFPRLTFFWDNVSQPGRVGLQSWADPTSLSYCAPVPSHTPWHSRAKTDRYLSNVTILWKVLLSGRMEHVSLDRETPFGCSTIHRNP